MTDQLREAQRLGAPAGKIPKLQQDVSTRWWATFLMLDRLIKLRPALDTMVLNNKLDAAKLPTDTEWQCIMDLHVVLKPFKFAQECLEGQKYVTGSLVPFVLKAVYSELVTACELAADDINPSVVACLEKMRDSFETRFGNFFAPVAKNVVRGFRKRRDSSSHLVRPCIGSSL